MRVETTTNNNSLNSLTVTARLPKVDAQQANRAKQSEPQCKDGVCLVTWKPQRP